MLRLKVILGSTREDRFSAQPAKWIADRAKAKGFEVEILDLRDYPLPFYHEPMSPSVAIGKGAYPFEASKAWGAKIAEGDAFIIIAPEYNHSFPAVLKNALDYTYPEWNRKPVAFVGYGSVGGARSIEQLRLVTAELQMASLRHAVYIVAPWNLLDEQGALKTEPFNETGDTMLDQLIWWGNALKEARDKEKGNA